MCAYTLSAVQFTLDAIFPGDFLTWPRDWPPCQYVCISSRCLILLFLRLHNTTVPTSQRQTPDSAPSRHVDFVFYLAISAKHPITVILYGLPDSSYCTFHERLNSVSILDKHSSIRLILLLGVP
ncbi:unnamed protein product [Periconia digitata]|uniref:Uncharacterized protein n=1 Tax=Periconia digitata TaxID=1303443 RepID=A0A9W4UJ52_9PLEO|nr:unnamed protein product [Periconia digitata]